MHLRAFLFASLLVLGSFTTACVGGEGEQVDEDDEAQAVEVSAQSGTVSVKDTKTTTTTTTTTTKNPCEGSKVKTSCKQWEQVKDFLQQ